MKITVENIEQEYPKINIPLPEPLAKDKFEKLTTTFLPNYDKSDVIKNMVDTFVLKLNEAVSKAAPKADAKPAPKAKAKPKAVTKSPKSVTKPPKTSKKPQKPQQKTTCNKKASITKVESFPEDLRLIRRFHAAVGKERQRRTILGIYRDMEKRITERKVNKNSTHAALITEISGKLKKVLDAMSKGNLTHVTISQSAESKSFFEKVEAVARGMEIRSSVNLLKRFIGIEGEQSPDKAKVKRLADAFNSSLKRGKVCESDLYFAEFKEALAAMNAFLEGKNKGIKISTTSLQGLSNVVGLGKPKAVSRSLDGTAETGESISFNKAILKAKREGIKPTQTFKLGQPKSTLKEFIGNKKMFLNGGVIIKAMKKNKDHALMWHNLINLPDRLNEPTAIFLSKTKGFVILTEIIDYKTKPVMASIHFNDKSEIFDIKSMYARSNIKIYQRWKDENLMLWSNEKSDLVKRHLATIARATPKSLLFNKDTKTKPKSNLSGVENEPVVVNRFQVDISQPVEQPVVKTEDNQPEKEELSGLFSPITYNPPESTHDKIDLPGDLGRFLGYVERYEYSILLRGEKGAGKTRMLYQMMNTFAKAGFKVGSFSLEIGKQSNLIRDMRNSYISPTIANNVFIADAVPNGLEDIKAAAKQFDVVCIDSWGKIPGTKADDFDKLRKEFPKTMFIVIFQSTTNGTARGGSMPEYDAGIVIQVADGGRATCEKNRYNGEDLTYLVFQRKLEEPEPQPAV